MRVDDPRATLLNQPTKFGPGMVGIITGELTRYAGFWFHALAIPGAIPAGTAITGQIGSDIPEARNHLIEQMLATEAEWLWFVDDDHTFPHEIVMALLARNVDIVAPLVLRRQSPFWPIATGLDGNFLDLAKTPPNELVPVMQCGTSGMLLRRKVVEALEDPWFTFVHDADGRRVSEDVNFCRMARAAGFEIHVDTSITMGHTTTATVEPVWDDERDGWMTGITVAGEATIYMGVTPPPDPAEAEAESVEA